MKKNVHIDCSNCSGRSRGIFCDLKKASLDKLNADKNVNIYKKGQSLFLSGNPPLGLYCVNQGRVKLIKTDAEGNETIVRLEGPGSVLGYRSLFSDSPYKASAKVVEEATICFISKSTIQELIQKDPSLLPNIVQRIGREMGAAEDRMASMAKKSLRERFSESLLLLKENFGVDVEDGVRIEVKLTREEWASLSGGASENIIRLISEFKEKKIIREEDKKIVLLDVSAIEESASFGY